MLAWDNTPRRGAAAHVAHNATPKIYRQWLEAILQSEQRRSGAESLVFINAWNEWGEGTNLEPDTAFGDGFLRATREALEGAMASQVGSVWSGDDAATPTDGAPLGDGSRREPNEITDGREAAAVGGKDESS